MSFLRRKSGVYHEDIYLGDPEPQQHRRRLSKSQTARYSPSPPKPSVFSSHQLTGPKIFTRPGQDSSRTSSANDSREAVRSRLTSPTSSASDRDSNRSKPRAPMSAYLAMTVSHDSSAQASSSQLSLVSPNLPTQSISRMLSAKRATDNRKQSISSLGSRDPYPGDHDLSNVSPDSSSEKLAADGAPPPRRNASFAPGTATRVQGSPRRVLDEESESTINLAEAIVMRKTSVRDVPKVEVERAWSPPPPNHRSSTPTNLDVTHIGRLGLGSLHVVNGRVSPTPSDRSKVVGSIWAPTVKRETSSTYPESEVGTVKSRKTIHSDWEDEPVPSLTGDGSTRSKPETRPDVQRTFSFNPGSETSFNKTGKLSILPMPGIDSSIITPPEDKTTVMAKDYMSDFPTSPFAESPPETSPILFTMDTQTQVEVPASPQTPPRISTPVHSFPPQTLEDRSSPVSAGSVRRYSDRAHGRRSFVDEALTQPPVADRAISPASFFSVPEPEDEVDLPFASAVEIQPVTPRSRSPRKLSGRSPHREARNSREAARGPISDSGYSSNTSLGAVIAPSQLRTQAGLETPEKEKRRILRFPFQKMQKSGKPILVKPTASTKVPSPTSARIESVSALTSQTSFLPTDISTADSSTVLSISPLKTKEKRKKLIKLRRKSTVEVAGSLVVQRLASVDCLNVPPVSTVSQNNLAERARALPELDRTYRTQDHTARSTNGSVLSLATAAKELRFPSPPPEDEERSGRNKRSSSRSRSRGRSFSRPRSWLIWPRKDKSGSRGTSREPDKTRSELNDLGSVADLLGDNPYDIAQRPRTVMPPSAWNNRPNFMRRQTTPSNISSNNPRPKSQMDDQTASILSSLRRRSISDRDSRNSMEQQGTAAWRPPHDLHALNDVPPLPPVPSAEEINRRFSYRHGYATHPNPLPYRSNTEPYDRNSQAYEDDDQNWYEHDQPQYQDDQPRYPDQHENQYSDELFLSEPHEAPPPPPHSPRPMYVDDEDTQHYVDGPERIYSHEEAPLPPRHSPIPSYIEHPRFEHAIEDDGPPPPSHSPRPMDIMEQRSHRISRDPSWSGEANAWKARRQSAGEALRGSWTQSEQYQNVTQQSNNETSNPTVPRRKPVPNRWTMQEDIQQPSYQQWRSDDFQQQQRGDEFHGHPRNQPMHSQNAVQYHHQPDHGYSEQPQHYQQYEQSHHDYRERPSATYPRQDYNEYSCYEQQQNSNSNSWRQRSPQRASNQLDFYQDYNGQPQYLPTQHQYQQHPHQQYQHHHQTQHFHTPSSERRQPTYPPSTYHNNASPTRSPTRNPNPNQRSPSRHSQNQDRTPRRSFASDVPRPDISPIQRRSQPQIAPASHLIHTQPGIGRYEGGLDLTYDNFRRPNDGMVVGGSRGGDNSGAVRVGGGGGDMERGMNGGGKKRHSWLDMESYGAEMEDVPGVPLVVGNVAGRMIYR